MYTPIEMDKMRNLRYGMKGISNIEKRFGKPITKIDLDSLTMEETAVIIWGGLVHEDKELTIDKVMDIIDEKGNLTEVLQAMSKAMEESFGVSNKEVMPKKGKKK